MFSRKTAIAQTYENAGFFAKRRLCVCHLSTRATNGRVAGAWLPTNDAKERRPS
jgi:hypothetical protein